MNKLLDWYLVVLIAAATTSTGCIYSARSAGASPDYVKDTDEGITVTVDMWQYYSCIYPPGTTLSKSVFHVKSDAHEMLLEPLLRLPTIPLELLYNAFADDHFLIQSKTGAKLSKRLMDGTTYWNDVENNVSEMRLENGKTCKLPFLVENGQIKIDKAPDKPVMKELYADTDGWLWFSGHVATERFWGISSGINYNTPILLCKVSSKTGEVVPIIERGFFEQVYLVPGQTDFVELHDRHKRRFEVFQGLSRFFMQSHL